MADRLQADIHGKYSHALPAERRRPRLFAGQLHSRQLLLQDKRYQGFYRSPFCNVSV